MLPAYSASGLQFIGDSMCRANALFEPHLGALAASDALAANAASGFSDAQHSLLGSSFYTGGALATSEPGVAAGGLPLADFDTSAKLVRGRARVSRLPSLSRQLPGTDGALCVGAGCAPRLVCRRAVQQRRGLWLGRRDRERRRQRLRALRIAPRLGGICAVRATAAGLQHALLAGQLPLPAALLIDSFSGGPLGLYTSGTSTRSSEHPATCGVLSPWAHAASGVMWNPAYASGRSSFGAVGDVGLHACK